MLGLTDVLADWKTFLLADNGLRSTFPFTAIADRLGVMPTKLNSS